MNIYLRFHLENLTFFGTRISISLPLDLMLFTVQSRWSVNNFLSTSGLQGSEILVDCDRVYRFLIENDGFLGRQEISDFVLCKIVFFRRIFREICAVKDGVKKCAILVRFCYDFMSKLLKNECRSNTCQHIVCVL